jgi:hypothetical protein
MTYARCNIMRTIVKRCVYARSRLTRHAGTLCTRAATAVQHGRVLREQKVQFRTHGRCAMYNS